MRSAMVAALLVWGTSSPAYAQKTEPAAVPVGTILAERKPFVKTLDFVGRVEAIDRVEVRARIKGFLEKVLFREGDMIQAGVPLYRIEQGLFEADVQQAQGALERSKAALALSKIQLDRAEQLLTTSSGTVVARDQARAQNQQAAGAVAADEANLKTAKINLGYTEITAPITGKIGRTNVTIGNVVGPDSGVLTVIVSQDPMYVTFPVSQREFLRVRENAQQLDLKDIKVRISFSDGKIYDQIGTINFLDVTVDRATDTVLARATFANPTGALTDSQLVRVAIETGAPEQKVAIPQAALIADQGGAYVFVVEDGKAAMKRVKVGAERGTDAVIESGLSGGEQVIVEGLQAVRPSIAVHAAPMRQPVSGT